jgi:hypothetical protein
MVISNEEKCVAEILLSLNVIQLCYKSDWFMVLNSPELNI